MVWGILIVEKVFMVVCRGSLEGICGVVVRLVVCVSVMMMTPHYHHYLLGSDSLILGMVVVVVTMCLCGGC